MVNRKFSLILILIVSFIWILIFFIIPSENQYSITGNTMGTTYEVKINDKLTDSQIQLIKKDVDSILVSINQSMSTYISDSEISLINTNTFSGQEFIVSEDFRYVLDKSLEYYILTEGAFDVTVRPLLKLWGFKGETIYKTPKEETVRSVLSYTGSDNIILKKNKLLKKHPKLELDFGAIAKGYAVDKISEYLINSGYLIHYVEIGGEIICKGKKWNIQIAYPEFLSKKGFQILSLDNHAIATSGTYNQFIKIDDFEYSHIFDPRLGKPVKNNIVSITVISDKSIDSDALSTSLKVLGKDKGVNLINELNGIECMFILKDQDDLKSYYSNNFSSFLLD